MGIGKQAGLITTLIICLLANSAADAQGQQVHDYMLGKLAQLRVRDGQLYRETFIVQAMEEFRQHAGEDQIVDQTDVANLATIQTAARASLRTAVVERIMKNDLDADGEVREDELKSALRFSPSNRRQVTDESINQLAEAYFVADLNRDRRIAASEAGQYGAQRAMDYSVDDWTPAIETLLSMDLDRDGRLTANDVESMAQLAFDSFDKDGDGRLAGAEMQELDDIRASAAGFFGTMTCNLPAPTAKAQIVLAVGSPMDTLSNVTITGQNDTTRAQTLSVAEGDTPIYLLANAHFPMIWKMTGNTDRIERIVLPGSSGGEVQDPHGNAVAGLDRDKVTFANPRCFPTPVVKGIVDAETALPILAKSLRRQPADILLVNGSLPEQNKQGVQGDKMAPTPGVVFLRSVLEPFDSKGGRIDRQTYESMLHSNAGGVTHFDVDDVIGPRAVKVYQILPQQAGLMQLLEQGLIEPVAAGVAMSVKVKGSNRQINRTGYRIVAPFPRLPADVNVLFVLPKGIPLPKGSYVVHTVISEETGQPIAPPRYNPDLDPFRDLANVFRRRF
ncbi:MAG: hypothetical protein AB7P20_16665 [Rhizobiaceae bacterium]